MTDTPALISSYTPQFFLNTWVTTWAAQIGVTQNLQPGKATLAIAECTVSQVTVLQFLAGAVAAFSRAQTSTGADLDSFMAQFGFTREPAGAGIGTVVFSTAVPATQQIVIPVDTIVQTPGGQIQYKVIADNSNPSFNAGLNGYVIPIGQSSANVTVQATQAGTAFNVQNGQLTQILNTIFGISSVTNPSAIIDGTNIESDAAFRKRFVDWLNSLAKGTYQALLLALEDVAGLTKVALYENVKAIGSPPTSFIYPNTPHQYPPMGNIVAIVSDGSNSPPGSLIQAAWNAVNVTRAFGIMFQVLPPQIVNLNINVAVRINGNADQATVYTNIQNAIIAYVQALPIGQTVSGAQLTSIALGADPAVLNVQSGCSGLSVNNKVGDLVLEPWQMAYTTAGMITVGSY